MIDWTRSMKQTFEFYTVDPGTWMDDKLITNVEGCTIVRDLNSETRGSASLQADSDYTDKYVRVYLVATQDNERNRFVLGTHIYQTPSVTFDGARSTMDQEGYTPLIELKEKCPPLGYAVPKGQNILKVAGIILDDNVRAPYIKQVSDDCLADNFIANVDDTYLTFVTDLISNAGYLLDVNAFGQVSFMFDQEAEKLQPVWTYTDDNSSILLPDVTIDRDLYGIPNVVEVLYSTGDADYIYVEAVNDSVSSPISTVNRGRRVVYRETNPDVPEGVNEDNLQVYAEHLLKEMSTLEYTVQYSHGYCPVEVGDCVRLNYKRAGLNGINAKVVRQSIKCETSCQVDEVAVYTKSLWE